MNAEFLFKDEGIVKVNSVCAVGDFNEKGKLNLIKESNGVWKAALQIDRGQYAYQYLINEELLINDPYANMYSLNDQEQLVSCLIINEEGKRLVNTVQYEMALGEYEISSSMDGQGANTKRHFNVQEDESICLGISFEKIEGMHTLTVIWISTDNNVYDYITYQLGIDIKEKQKVWTQMNIDKFTNTGIWQVKCLLDGKLIKEEKFQVVNKPVEKYLPIGSVVKLEGANKAVMIYGIGQITEKGQLWDYVACMYPEGNMGRQTSIFFNHDGIEEIQYLGFETPEAADFQKAVKAAVRQQENEGERGNGQ